MFDVGSIVGSMVLDTSKWDKAIVSIQAQTRSLSEKMKNFGDEMISSGRSLDKIGNKMMIMGALITAPLGLAFNSAAKYNSIFQTRIDDLTKSFERLQQELATAILPWVDRLNSAIRSLVDWLGQLNPIIKDLVINSVMWGAVFLMLAGFTVKLIGDLKIIGGLLSKGFAAANPILAIIIGIAAATALIWIFRDSLFAIGIALKETFVKGFDIVVSSIAIGLNKIMIMIDELMLKIPFMHQVMKDNLQKDIAGFQNNISKLKQNISNDFEAIGKAWSDLIDKLFKKSQTTTNIAQQFGYGFKSGLSQAIKDLSNFGQLGKDIASRTASAMTSSFSDLFFNVITLQFNNMKQVAQSFGTTILRMLADIIARVVMYFAIIGPLVAAFPTLAPAFGIPGHAEGISSVPYTGLYKLHSGEEVVPKYDSTKSGEGQGLTIYNLITPGAVASAMMSREGRGVVINIIDENSMRNGVIRREVNRR